MVRMSLATFVFLLSAVLASAAPAGAEDDKKEKTDVSTPLSKQLKQPVNFGGFEKDERMTLRDALDQLSELYEVNFLVNEHAFKREDVNEVRNTTPVDKEPLPKMRGVTLEVLLKTVLARVPSTSGATFVVRDRFVEITTMETLSKEVRGHFNSPLPPLVKANFDRMLLGEALRVIGEITEYNVVVDGRVGDKAKTPVTARFDNVPIDTAVRLLADMGGLRSIPIDNVLYVTTVENAKSLQEEEEKRRLKHSGAEKPGEAPFVGPPERKTDR